MPCESTLIADLQCTHTESLRKINHQTRNVSNATAAYRQMSVVGILALSCRMLLITECFFFSFFYYSLMFDFYVKRSSNSLTATPFAGLQHREGCRELTVASFFLENDNTAVNVKSTVKYLDGFKPSTILEKQEGLCVNNPAVSGDTSLLFIYLFIFIQRR